MSKLGGIAQLSSVLTPRLTVPLTDQPQICWRDETSGHFTHILLSHCVIWWVAPYNCVSWHHSSTVSTECNTLQLCQLASNTLKLYQLASNTLQLCQLAGNTLQLCLLTVNTLQLCQLAGNTLQLCHCISWLATLINFVS